jgi:anti-sigma regulatory factor (Ser/Thr protein kinase)
MRVRITVADSSVDVAVSDQGTWRAPSPDGGGMGLGIIESIADDVDLSTTPDGTTLRFRIALGGSAEGTPISTS